MIQLLLVGIGLGLALSLNASEHAQASSQKVKAAFSALFDAMNAGDIDDTHKKLQALQAYDKKPTWPRKNHMPYAFNLLLKIKAKPNSAAILECCVIAGMPIRERATDLHTLMHMAATHNDAPTVTYLASIGLDVNGKTAAGRTPLHFAVYYNTPSVAATLISLGADPHKRHSDGSSPYMCIDEWKRDDMRPAFEQAMRDKGIAFLSLSSAPHSADHRVKLEPLEVDSSSPTTDDGMDDVWQ